MVADETLERHKKPQNKINVSNRLPLSTVKKLGCSDTQDSERIRPRMLFGTLGKKVDVTKTFEALGFQFFH